MSTLEEMLGIDPNGESYKLAQSLVKSDKAWLNNLVEIRKYRGMTKEQVAEILGVDISRVNALESNDGNVTIGFARRYAFAVRASVDHYVEGN